MIMNKHIRCAYTFGKIFGYDNVVPKKDLL